MTRFLLSIILMGPLALVGCDSPQSLRTAQMTPAIMPVSQRNQAQAEPISLDLGRSDTAGAPTTAAVVSGRR